VAIIGAGGIGFDVADFLTHPHTSTETTERRRPGPPEHLNEVGWGGSSAIILVLKSKVRTYSTQSPISILRCEYSVLTVSLAYPTTTQDITNQFLKTWGIDPTISHPGGLLPSSPLKETIQPGTETDTTASPGHAPPRQVGHGFNICTPP